MWRGGVNCLESRAMWWRHIGLVLLILMFSGHATLALGHGDLDVVTCHISQSSVESRTILLSEPDYMTGVMPIVRGQGLINYTTGNGKCYPEIGWKGFLFRFSLSNGVNFSVCCESAAMLIAGHQYHSRFGQIGECFLLSDEAFTGTPGNHKPASSIGLAIKIHCNSRRTADVFRFYGDIHSDSITIECHRPDLSGNNLNPSSVLCYVGPSCDFNSNICDSNLLLASLPQFQSGAPKGEGENGDGDCRKGVDVIVGLR